MGLQEASKGPMEKLLYVPAIVIDKTRPDYLATVDADPTSATYSQA
jgi:selenium-binding protein 1